MRKPVNDSELYRDFMIEVLSRLPRLGQISPREMEHWLNDGEGLKMALQGALLHRMPFNPDTLLVPVTEAFSAERVVAFGFAKRDATKIRCEANAQGWETIDDIRKKSFLDLSRRTPRLGERSAFVIKAILLGVYHLDLAPE